MKSKINQLNNSANIPFSKLLQTIEDDFNLLLKENGGKNLLPIAKALLSPAYLNSLNLNKHSLKLAKNKIFSLVENTVITVVENQYDEKLKEKLEDNTKYLPLDILYSMAQPKYTKSIIETSMSNELKNTTTNAVKKAIYNKAETLGLSKEEFDKFVTHPKLFLLSKPEFASISSIDTISFIAKANSPKIKNNQVTDKTPTFFDEVKGYTNNFKNFIIDSDIEISRKPKQKFNNYEEYLKFYTFQQKLNTYILDHNTTELETINKILNKQTKNFEKLDNEFIKILEERKNVILSQTRNKNTQNYLDEK